MNRSPYAAKPSPPPSLLGQRNGSLQVRIHLVLNPEPSALNVRPVKVRNGLRKRSLCHERLWRGRLQARGLLFRGGPLLESIADTSVRSRLRRLWRGDEGTLRAGIRPNSGCLCRLSGRTGNPGRPSTRELAL